MGLTYARTVSRQSGGGSSGALDQALRKLSGNFVSNAPEYVTTGSIAWTPPIGTSGLSGLTPHRRAHDRRLQHGPTCSAKGGTATVVNPHRPAGP